MKKLIIFALALSLALTLATPVSAAVADYLVTGIDSTPKKANDDGYIPDTEASTSSNDPDRINFGDTVYYALESSHHPNGYVTESDAISNVTIKKSWDSGSSYVEAVSFAKKREATSGNYRYYLGLTLRESSTKTDVDICGTITIKKTGTNGFDATDNTVALDVNLTVGKPRLDAYDGMTLTDEDVVYEFYNDEEYLINLGEGPSGTFEVEGSDQTLTLSFDTEYDEDISDRYSEANLDFYNGNGAHFSKTGTLVLYANEGSFLYSVDSSGNLTRLFIGYDDDENGFSFTTRTLGRYVVSDKLLNVSSVTSSSTASYESSSTYTESTASSTASGAPTGGGSTVIKKNPATGAISDR